MIGALALGMLVGMFTAVAALFSGYSFLAALLLYSAVGTMSAVVSLTGLHLALGNRHLGDSDA